MKSEEVKQLNKQELGVGCFSADDPWISSKDMVTSQVLAIGTDRGGMEISIPLKYYDAADGKKGDTLLERDDKKGEAKKYSIFTNKNGNLLCVAIKKQEFIFAENCIYYYRTTPSFQGQAPSEETLESIKGAKKCEEDPSPYDKEPLYVWTRLVTVTKDNNHVRRALLDFCKGMDSDSISGYAWMSLYKAVQMSQFMYEALVLDMQGNVVCKSKQKGALDSSGMYRIAPNADMLLIILACQRLTPDGAKIMEGVETAVEVLSLGIGV